MTDLLARLAARATNNQSQIRPQTISRFEPDSADAPLLIEAEETLAADPFDVAAPTEALAASTSAVETPSATPGTRRASRPAYRAGGEQPRHPTHLAEATGSLPTPHVSAPLASAPNAATAETQRGAGQQQRASSGLAGPIARARSIASPASTNAESGGLSARGDTGDVDTARADTEHGHPEMALASDELEMPGEQNPVPAELTHSPRDQQQQPNALDHGESAPALDTPSALAGERPLLVEAASGLVSPSRTPGPPLAPVEPGPTTRGLAATPERAPATTPRDRSAPAEHPKPAIRITIGRVEVRAAAPAPGVVRTLRPEPALSLDSYLASFEAKR